MRAKNRREKLKEEINMILEMKGTFRNYTKLLMMILMTEKNILIKDKRLIKTNRMIKETRQTKRNSNLK